MQYRGIVLLWPKSDESKKSLVLLYLFIYVLTHLLNKEALTEPQVKLSLLRSASLKTGPQSPFGNGVKT